MDVFLTLTLSYLIGSINGAIVTTKLFKLKDPRGTGSGNPGATNMYRTNGKTSAAIALAIDFLKGFATMAYTDQGFYPTAAAAICIGHIFPIYHGFKGGKGVAVTAGIIFACSYKLGIICLCAWLLSFLIFRISSISATISVLVCLFSYFFAIIPQDIYLTLLIPCIAVIACHKENYIRLIKGQEAPTHQESR